jgi:hypothetical protein
MSPVTLQFLFMPCDYCVVLLRYICEGTGVIDVYTSYTPFILFFALRSAEYDRHICRGKTRSKSVMSLRPILEADKFIKSVKNLNGGTGASINCFKNAGID